MRITKIPKSPEIEMRLNFNDEVDYHNKRCGKAMMTATHSKFMNYDLLVDYFTRLQNSELNEHDGILLCYPYNKEKSRDALKRILASNNEIFGSGKIVEINKREVVFSFKIIPTLSPDEIRRLKIHIEELMYGIDEQTHALRIEFSRIVVERR